MAHSPCMAARSKNQDHLALTSNTPFFPSSTRQIHLGIHLHRVSPLDDPYLLANGWWLSAPRPISIERSHRLIRRLIPNKLLYANHGISGLAYRCWQQQWRKTGRGGESIFTESTNLITNIDMINCSNNKDKQIESTTHNTKIFDIENLIEGKTMVGTYLQ